VYKSIRNTERVCEAGKAKLRWWLMTVRRPKIEEIREKVESLVRMLESLEYDVKRRRYHEAYRRVSFASADAKELLELLEEYDPCVDCGCR